ncbi:hypothetical protein MRX96_022793 [Rhipicephalus microplus]
MQPPAGRRANRIETANVSSCNFDHEPPKCRALRAQAHTQAGALIWHGAALASQLENKKDRAVNCDDALINAPFPYKAVATRRSVRHVGAVVGQ